MRMKTNGGLCAPIEIQMINYTKNEFERHIQKIRQK